MTSPLVPTTSIRKRKSTARWNGLVGRYVDVKLRDLVEWLLAVSFLVGVVGSWAWLFGGKVWALLLGFLVVVGLGFVYRRNVEFYRGDLR